MEPVGEPALLERDGPLDLGVAERRAAVRDDELRVVLVDALDHGDNHSARPLDRDVEADPLGIQSIPVRGLRRRQLAVIDRIPEAVARVHAPKRAVHHDLDRSAEQRQRRVERLAHETSVGTRSAKPLREPVTTFSRCMKQIGM